MREEMLGGPPAFGLILLHSLGVPSHWRRHGHVEFPWRCQDVDSTSATFDILQSW